MKQLTIRGIPKEVEEMIKQEAKKNKISINKAFISLLEKTFGIKKNEKKKKILYHDLDNLFGKWIKEEEKIFTDTLNQQRKIDTILWKK